MFLVNFVVSLFAGLRAANFKRGGFALIKLGGAVSDIRGSIGGTVYSRNRYGAYARNRTIPVNPGSALQGEIRSAISLCRYQYFDVLTAAQREAWEVYAFNTEIQNRLGETIKLTGYNMFCRANLAQIYTGGDTIVAAPTDYNLGETDPAIAVTVSDGVADQLSIAFDDTLPWLDEDGSKLLVYASRPQNPGINYFKGPYQFAGSVDGDGTTPPTTPATMTAPFEYAVGQKVFFQFRILRADGRLSAPFRTSGVAS